MRTTPPPQAGAFAGLFGKGGLDAAMPGLGGGMGGGMGGGLPGLGGGGPDLSKFLKK